MGTSTAVDDLAARQKQLTQLLLLTPALPVAEQIRRMGISRAWYYELRKRLVDLGIFFPQEAGTLPGDQYVTTLAHPISAPSAPHHAPVRHVYWLDDLGTTWAVQGALLDRWDGKSWPDALPDERVIAVRRSTPLTFPTDTDALFEHRYTTWVASRRSRWTTRNTQRNFLPGALTLHQAQRLTRAVAWALEVDAVIPLEEQTDIEIALENGPHGET